MGFSLSSSLVDYTWHAAFVTTLTPYLRAEETRKKVLFEGGSTSFGEDVADVDLPRNPPVKFACVSDAPDSKFIKIKIRIKIKIKIRIKIRIKINRTIIDFAITVINQ